MKMISVVTICVAMTCAGSASAQTSPSTTPVSRGYVEGVVQSASGNVTSQSFGGEFGVAVAERIQLFVEAGQVRDAAPATLGAGAGLMAGYMSQTQSNVTYAVKQPVSFGLAGVRLGVPVASGRLEPYVITGAGVARVKRDVHFTAGGTDVTSTLDQFGVTLGTDLSGSETRGMFSVGGGVAWLSWQRLVVDLQYRYGRIFTSGQGTNVNRAGVGVGVRF